MSKPHSNQRFREILFPQSLFVASIVMMVTVTVSERITAGSFDLLSSPVFVDYLHVFLKFHLYLLPIFSFFKLRFVVCTFGD